MPFEIERMQVVLEAYSSRFVQEINNAANVYAAFVDQISRAQRSLSRLDARVAPQIDTSHLRRSVQEIDGQLEVMIRDWEKARAEVSRIQTEIATMPSRRRMSRNVLRDQLRIAKEEADQLMQSIKRLQQEAISTERKASGTQTTSFERMNQYLEQSVRLMSDFATQSATARANLRDTGTEAQRLVSILRMVGGQRTASATAGLTAQHEATASEKDKASAAERVARAAKQTATHTRNTGVYNRNIISMFGRFLQMMIVFRSLFYVFSLIGQGMQGAYYASERVGKSLDSIKTSAIEMANSFVVMMLPIVKVLAPMLDWLAKKAMEIGNTVAQFLAALMGQETYLRAVSTDAKWGKPIGAFLKDGTENAEDLNNQLKEIKKTILGFDEFNILQKPKESAIKIPKEYEYNPATGFATEETPVAYSIKAKADQVREWFETSYAWLERFVGTIIDTLTPAATWLWENILKPFGKWVSENPETVAKVITGIVLAVGGFQTVTGVASIVRGIAEAVSTLLPGVEKLLPILKGPVGIVALIVALAGGIWLIADHFEKRRVAEQFGDLSLSVQDAQKIIEAFVGKQAEIVDDLAAASTKLDKTRDGLRKFAEEAEVAIRRFNNLQVKTPDDFDKVHKAISAYVGELKKAIESEQEFTIKLGIAFETLDEHGNANTPQNELLRLMKSTQSGILDQITFVQDKINSIAATAAEKGTGAYAEQVRNLMALKAIIDKFTQYETPTYKTDAFVLEKQLADLQNKKYDKASYDRFLDLTIEQQEKSIEDLGKLEESTLRRTYENLTKGIALSKDMLAHPHLLSESERARWTAQLDQYTDDLKNLQATNKASFEEARRDLNRAFSPIYLGIAEGLAKNLSYGEGEIRDAFDQLSKSSLTEPLQANIESLSHRFRHENSGVIQQINRIAGEMEKSGIQVNQNFANGLTQGGRVTEESVIGFIKRIVGPIDASHPYVADVAREVATILGDSSLSEIKKQSMIAARASKEFANDLAQGMITGLDENVTRAILAAHGFTQAQLDALFSRKDQVKQAGMDQAMLIAKGFVEGMDIHSGYAYLKSMGFTETQIDAIMTSVHDKQWYVEAMGKELGEKMPEGFEQSITAWDVRGLINQKIKEINRAINGSDLAAIRVALALPDGVIEQKLDPYSGRLNLGFSPTGVGYRMYFPDVATYATGGFPNVGDMFIANERGIEMMGFMGSQPVVANNQQIIEAFKQAFRDVMRETASGQGVGNPNVKVQIGNEAIDRHLIRVMRENGWKAGTAY